MAALFHFALYNYRHRSAIITSIIASLQTLIRLFLIFFKRENSADFRSKWRLHHCQNALDFVYRFRRIDTNAINFD